MQTIAWSWSRLEKFEQCPKLFHGLNISKEIKMDNDNPIFVRGRGAHSALDTSMQNLLQGRAADLPPILTDVHPPIKLAHVEPLLQRLYAAPNFKYIYTEQQLAFTTDMQRVGWFSKHPPVWLRVGLDLIAIDPDRRNAVVIDYKTGKHREVEYGRGQLALFAIGAFAAYDTIDTVTTHYIWIEHKRKTTQKYTREQYPDLLHEFGERSELIQICNASGNWEAKKNPRCKWCPCDFGWCEYKI